MMSISLSLSLADIEALHCLLFWFAYELNIKAI